MEINRLVSEGVLKPISYSKYASPIVPVLKANGDVRICGDFSVSLNKQLEIERYPLPRVEELFSKLHGGQEFTKLDLSSAYMQLCLSEESQPLTCVNTHKGLFVYTRLIYGLSCAPSIFQKTIDSIISGIEGVLVFQDDILISGVNRKQHLDRLEMVLAKLQASGLVLQKQKCSYFQKSISYLGFTIDKHGLHKSPDKIKAILEAAPPTNVSQLKSFLGFINYYRMFVPNAATLISPLYELLHSDVKWNWTASHNNIFNKIKKELSSDRVLAHFSYEAKLILTVDASPTGLGAVLSQIENDQEKPISFASRVLSKAERNYSQIQKEATAIIFGIRRYHQYLYGRSQPFVLRTDHRPLLSIFKPGKGVPEVSANRLQRYAIFLSAYNYIIEYVRTDKNCADFLSRSHPDTFISGASGSVDQASQVGIKRDVDITSYVNYVCSGSLPIFIENIKLETKNDGILKQIVNFVVKGWPKKCLPNFNSYFKCRNDISYENGYLLRGHKLIIPECLRKSILSELHHTHLGIQKMKSEARCRFRWPNIDTDIDQYVGSCKICRELRAEPPRAPLTPWPFPAKPWERVHIDLLGPIANKVFLVAVDAYSKWVECFELNKSNSVQIIDKLQEIISRFGIMDTIVSDNGAYFTSQEFKHFCSLNGIKHLTSPPYSPASNGQAEAYVKIVKKALKGIIASGCSKLEFNNKLREFLFSYRNSKHSVTEESPAKLLFGKQLKSRLDLLITAKVQPPPPPPLSSPPTALSNVVERNQSLQCKYYRGSRSTKFAPDDCVLARCVKNNIKNWLPGVVKKKIGRSVYIIFIPSLNVNLKKHTNQLCLDKSILSYDTNPSVCEPEDLNDFWIYTTSSDMRDISDSSWPHLSDDDDVSVEVVSESQPQPESPQALAVPETGSSASLTNSEGEQWCDATEDVRENCNATEQDTGPTNSGYQLRPLAHRKT